MPIFAAIKLTAQTMTMTAMEAAIAARLGTRPLEVSILTASDQALFANRQFLDQIAARLETDAGTGWNTDGTLGRDGDLR